MEKIIALENKKKRGKKRKNDNALKKAIAKMKSKDVTQKYLTDAI